MKNIIILVLMISKCAFIINLKAQFPLKIADHTFGGNQWDTAEFINRIPGGGYIIGGVSSSAINGSKTAPNFGGFDFWIQKFVSVSNAAAQWQVTFGGNNSDILSKVIPTQDGGYIVGGYSFSGISGNKTTPGFGGWDYWVIKLNADGDMKWEKTFGGTGNDYLTDLQQTKDGGYIFGGTSDSPANGIKKEPSLGVSDMWVIRTDTNGVIIWENTIGGTDFDSLASLKQTKDGGYILGGTSSSPIGGDKVQPSKGGEDYWLVKIQEKGGNINWSRTIGSAYDDNLVAVEEVSTGGYFLAGNSSGNITGDKSEMNRGGVLALGLAFDYWVVRTDAQGNKLWDKTIGGIDDDGLFCAVQDNGGYLLGGQSPSPQGFEKSENQKGSYDMWVVKISEVNQGQVVWDRTLGGGGVSSAIYAMQVLSDRYLLAGTIGTAVNPKFDQTFPGYGQNDKWVLELSK